METCDASKLYVDTNFQQQLAKLVMRRDLAVCQERSGVVKPTQTTGASAPSTAERQQDSSQPTNSSSAEAEVKTDADTTMQDVPPTEPTQDAEMTDAKAEKSEDEQSRIDATSTDTKAGKPPEEPTAQPDTTQTDSKPADTALQIDTKPTTAEASQNPDDQPPDTGTFTNDLESLFGGPTSAGPVDGGDFNNNTEFDFGSFGANGGENDDNITSLLPGLQDYANNQSPTHASDFDKIFDLESVPIDPNQTQNDNTFDDLLDFEDFTGGDYGGGDGGNGHGGGDGDFNFDFD